MTDKTPVAKPATQVTRRKFLAGAAAGAAGALPAGAEPGICDAGDGMSAGAEGVPCGTDITPPASGAGRRTAVPV